MHYSPPRPLRLDWLPVRVEEADRAIVRTIIAVARTLDLRVIAKGVETAEQHRALTEEQCAEFQGYLYSAPLPAADVEALLTRGGAGEALLLRPGRIELAIQRTADEDRVA